jgi:predicted amidohydrolase YtcJ
MRETLLALALALLTLGFAGRSSASATLSAGTPVASEPAGPAVKSDQDGKADTIFYGGPVITMTKDSKGNMVMARAVAVRKGKIVAVGDEKSVRKNWEGPLTKPVNLGGHTLLPGFVEPHTHLTLTVQSQPPFSVDCGSQKPDLSIDAVYALLKQELKRVRDLKLPPSDQWVVGTGFDPSRSDPLFASLDAKTLDDNVTSKFPVFVLNASGHIAYANTEALNRAGITGTTKTVGVVMKDGKPTGQLNETPAVRLVSDLLPPPTYDALLAGAGKVIGQWAAAGVTTSTEISLGVATTVKTDWKLYKDLVNRDPNQLLPSPIRFRVYLDSTQVEPVNPDDPNDRKLRTRDKLPEVFEPNTGDDWLNVLGVKFVTDGSTQGFTAFLNQPYLDPAPSGNPPGWKGTFNFPTSTGRTLTEVMRPFYERRWQLVAHANGDAALDQVLDAYEKISKGDPNRRERRLRIEHFTVTPPQHLGQILKRVADLGATPGMTAGHLYFWGQVLDQKILGAERAGKIHPSNSLKASSIRFAYNSDSPVTKVEPLRYVQTEVTRVPQRTKLVHPSILGADERISVDDALRAVTLDAAYQDFFDDKVGSLEEGKLADFVVLDCNPRAVEPSTIANIQVLATYLEGKIAFQLLKPGPDSCHPIGATR